jgi:hypothetical protein
MLIISQLSDWNSVIGTHRAATGAFVTQQTCPPVQGWSGQGMPPSPVDASMPLVGGVKSHRWVEPLPQQPASATNAAAPSQGSNHEVRDIPVMVSQI